MLKLHPLRDGDYDMCLISDVFTDSDWPIYFIVKLDYTEEWGDHPKEKYYCSINAVSPEAAKAHWSKAAEQYSNDVEWFKTLSPQVQSEILMDYGIYAPLWQKLTSNKNELLREARKTLKEIEFLFGFWMDRIVNAIGDTGWDWIQGNIGAGRKRVKEESPS